VYFHFKLPQKSPLKALFMSAIIPAQLTNIFIGMACVRTHVRPLFIMTLIMEETCVSSLVMQLQILSLIGMGTAEAHALSPWSMLLSMISNFVLIPAVQHQDIGFTIMALAYRLVKDTSPHPRFQGSYYAIILVLQTSTFTPMAPACQLAIIVFII